MKMMEPKSEHVMLLLCSVFLIAFLSAAPYCMADDHKKGAKHFEKHDAGTGLGGYGRLFGGGRDKGNETTGQIVAWSLAAANLTVAISLIIKGLKRFVPLAPTTKNTLTKFNSTQKKYLMRFHYVLNPAIFTVAILHWSLSRCHSTMLPELGLLAMGALVALGLVLKLKLCKQGLIKNVYNIHTHPALLVVVISILAIGHLSMD